MFNIKLNDLLQREVYLHLLFWLLYICYPLLKFVNDEYIIVQFVAMNSNILLVLLFAYACYFYIFPSKISRKPLVLFSFLSLMTVFGVLISKYVLSLVVHQINYSYWTHALSVIGEYIFIGLLFFCFYIIKRNYYLEREKNSAELSSLKSQINPHFLFNTLNSIYSYSLEDNKKASRLILKLSDNFKYVLYEGQKNKVSVFEDLNHIKDFISLQKLRWQDKIEFELNEKIGHGDLKIAPLINITFIENAVKYTSKLKGRYHKIKIDYILEDNSLKFKCVNFFDKSYVLSDQWKDSGIGLKNTKRRLNLIYKDSHKLNIEESETKFMINLEVIL